MQNKKDEGAEAIKTGCIDKELAKFHFYRSVIP